MPSFERKPGHVIHYEVTGQGYPLLTFAPGGMRSNRSFWQRAPYNPVRELSNEFRVIALDQRNAGQSRAPITADDGWHSYTEDHLALLDHLEIDQCHVLGGCIGGAFSLALAHAAPTRVTGAVIQQSIGHSAENREVFYKLFEDWANEIAPQHPEVTTETWRAFRERMFGGDFVFSVTREQVRALPTPLHVLMGNDIYHPSAISREIVQQSRRAELVEQWKDADIVAQTVQSIRSFLHAHTPTVV